MELNRTGRSVLRVYLNMLEFPPSPALARLDTTRRAGAAIDLATRIWRMGTLTYDSVAAFAELATLSESDLRLVVLPILERQDMVVVRRDSTGSPVEVDEQVGVAAPVVEQCAHVWEALGPSQHERGVLASADLLAHSPLAESDHRNMLEATDIEPSLHAGVFAALQFLGLLRRQRSAGLREDVLYSPYVWGSEAVDIATFFHHLPANEREAMLSVSRTITERPGTSIEQVPGSQRLVESARKVGLIDATRVVTTGGETRTFGFPPALERQIGLASADTSHDRKLFAAHILFGHRFGFPGTGRIEQPLVLVQTLIDRGRVGPASAIRTDYPLLEARGIVQVDTTRRQGRAYLKLVKKDVAEDALRLLEVALGETAGQPSADRPLNGLWVPGVSYMTPERDRNMLGEIAGEEAEIIGSVVERLREEAARTMRQEEL